MINRALNSNNDIFIQDRSFRTVEDAAQVIQNIRSRILTYLGEWFLDNTAGIPYYEQIFVKPANLANAESLIKQKIINTPGVQQITSFETQFDRQTRILTISTTVDTIYGEIILTEVTVNA